MRTPLREQTVDRVLGMPALANDDLIVVDVAIVNGAQIIAAQPDVARNVVVTITDANTSITAGTVTIVGTDYLGRAITESYSIVGNLVYTTDKIFKTVVSVTVAALAGVTAVDDKIKVGTGDLIGLAEDIYNADAIKNIYLGDMTDITIAGVDDYTIGKSMSAIDVNSATYDGAKIMWYKINTYQNKKALGKNP